MRTPSVSAAYSVGVLLALAGSGRAMAVPPLPFPAVFDLASLDGGNGFILNGIDASDNSGWSVSSAGDVNGDGTGDLIIGAPGAAPDGRFRAGEAYVVFGGPGVGAPGSINLSGLNGTNGFVLKGVDVFDHSCASVSDAGDVNGDGYDDLIVGAYGGDPNGQGYAGEAYVVFGGPSVGASGAIGLSTLGGANGFVVNGINADDRFGFSVSEAGDLNGDGFGDVLIGAYRAAPNGQLAAGETYVVFGGTTVGASGTINASTLNGVNGFAVAGVAAGDYSGRSVSGAGDVNGDGYDDLLIGAYRATSYGLTFAGETYVVFGGASVGASGSLDAAALDGTNGFTIRGIDETDRSGHAVSSAGDVNGDGYADIIIGAYAADPNNQNYAGESYVVFGGPSVGAYGGIDLSLLDGSDGFVINGINPIDTSGRSVSAAGDVNGDGYDDVIIGAMSANASGRFYAGESYVVFGGPSVGASGSVNLSSLNATNGFTIIGIDASDYSGRAVASAGDFNGDGIDDLIIGASNADPSGQSTAGETYVVFGRAPALCAGDINGDGDTNAADFVILAGNFGAAVAPNTGGDLNSDGLVNAADFVILAGDFGCGTP